MSAQISPVEWLDHLLNTDATAAYLQDGGSLARIVTITDEQGHGELQRALEDQAERYALRYFMLAAPETTLSLPERVVRDLEQIADLRSVLDEYAQASWDALGYPSSGITLLEVSQEAGESTSDLRREFSHFVRTDLRRVTALTRDFRDAFRWAAMETIDGDGGRAARFVGSWLAGSMSRKDRHALGVHSPIRRSNATATVRSLMATSRFAGWRGSVLHLDARWITDPELFGGAVRAPTRQHRIWLYQWIRELIDSMPRWSATFVCVEFGAGFLDEATSGRGMGLYDALRIRIVDGVRPRGGQNPSAPLVSLSAGGRR